MSRIIGVVASLATTLAVTSTAHAAFVVSYEPETPGSQTSSTSATFAVSGTEDFSTYSTFAGGVDTSTTIDPSSNVAGSQQYANFTTDFGTGGVLQGVYSGVQVIAADAYGGAGGTGQYAVAFEGNRGQAYSLTLTGNGVPGANYFGYWLSALDKGNLLIFSKGSQEVFTFNPSDVLNALAKTGSSSAYYGNPNPSYSGQDGNEPFVYLNFFDQNDVFDKITFLEYNNGGAGYESDNHTVGFDVKSYGNGVIIPTTAIPEPAAWSLMIVGFGLMGAALRRRRAALLPSAA